MEPEIDYQLVFAARLEALETIFLRMYPGQREALDEAFMEVIARFKGGKL